MSIEREMLKKVISGDNKGDFFISYDLYKEIYEFLVHPEQTEQEPVAWQFRTFHSEYTVCPGWDVWEHCTEPKFNNVSEHVTKGFYQVRKLYTAPPKRELLSEADVEDAVDKCLANAIKAGWYPVNEDSYRQGFWDAVKFLEVGNE